MMESGKSTLMSLLDGHPDLLVFPQEPHFGRMLEKHLASAEEALRWSLEESPIGKHGRLRGIEDLQDDVFDHHKYCATLEGVLQEHFAPRDVMVATMHAFASATGQSFELCRYWIFNEPNRGRLAPWFFSTFPAGRVIHLLRDPREHYQAVKAHHNQAGTALGRFPALHFSMDWSLATSQALENRSKFGADRYMILRYEDISDNREEALRQTADFLGIEFDSKLSHPSKVGISAPPQADHISESNIGEWFRPITKCERLVVESCCANMMEDAVLNYRTSLPVALLRLTRGLLRRAVYGGYYGKRLLKGIVLPASLHELHRIERAVKKTHAFRL